MNYKPLSKPQEIMYGLDRFLGENICNLMGDIFLPNDFDSKKVVGICEKIVESNPFLNTRIVLQDAVPMQTIPDDAVPKVVVHHFDNYDEYEKWAEDDVLKSIDVFGCLINFAVCVVKNEGVYVNMKSHHILDDAWSYKLLYNYIKALYCEKEIECYSYYDYIEKENEYLHSDKPIKDKAYWLSLYNENREVNFLFNKEATNFAAKRKAIPLSKELSDKIRTFCNENNISLFSLFFLAVAIYFHRMTGKEHFYIGTPILNRSGYAEKNTIGHFINNVPIAIRFEDNFEAISAQISAQIRQALRHQKFHYGELLSELREQNIPLERFYDVTINFHSLQVGEYKTRWFFHNRLRESLVINIDDRDMNGFFTINYDYQTEKITDRQIEAVSTHMESLLQSIVTDKTQPMSKLKMLPATELETLLYTFNDTKAEYEKTKTLHKLLEEQAEKNPDKTALAASDAVLTYAQLNNQANCIAHNLLRQGIKLKPNEIVPVLLPRKSYLVSALFGVLKSGAAYLPIDPEYPQERIDFMLGDCGARFTISEENIMQLLEGNESEENPNVEMSSENLCYCIYTSGSTGTPKGTLIRHRNAMNFVSATAPNTLQTLTKTHGSVALAVANISFDISVIEIMMSLLNGLEAALADTQLPEQLADFMEKRKVDVLALTPSRFMQYIENDSFRAYFRHIKVLMLGAEELTQTAIETVKKYGNCTLFNGYGPAETTVGVCFGVITNDIHIGKPIANTQIYILDKYNNPTPIGVAGELCIAGDSVGAGYLNHPELTAEKFISNPFGEGKLYKTGDLARWREDGNIDFLRRMDNQVKIRGLRVELGEIEQTMLKVKGVAQSAVICHTQDDSQYLFAYYTGNAEAKEIRHTLSQTLPQYMIPHSFTKLDAMPTTSSGKLDRKSLPIPELSRISAATEFVAPRTEAENEICEAFKKVLKAEQVGMEDSFIELGGDSLKAIMLENELSARGIHVTVKDIMHIGTPRLLADSAMQISTTNSSEEDTMQEQRRFLEQPETISGELRDRALSAEDIEEIYPMTATQAALSTMYTVAPNGSEFQKNWLFPVKGDVEQRLESATRIFEILRTRFLYENGSRPVAVVQKACKVDFERMDISNLNKAQQETYIKGLVNIDKLQPFALDKAPLLRVKQIETAPEESVALVSWFLGILDKRGIELVVNHLTGSGFSPEKSTGFSRYARWAAAQSMEEAVEYWSVLLKDTCAETKLPKDGGVRVYIENDDFQRIAHYAKANAVSLATVVKRVWAEVLMELNCTDDVVFGYLVSGRSCPVDGINEMAGSFAIHVPVRFRKGESLEQLQEQHFQSEKYAYAPAGQIQRAAKVSHRLFGHVMIIGTEKGDLVKYDQPFDVSDAYDSIVRVALFDNGFGIDVPNEAIGEMFRAKIRLF